MSEQIFKHYTAGDPNVCVAAVGLTVHRDVEGGVWSFDGGPAYMRQDFASYEALQEYVRPLYDVAQVEGYLSAEGIVTWLDYHADRHEYVWSGYNAWKLDEYAKLAAVSLPLAEREANRLFGQNHGKWVTPERIRAADFNFEVRRVSDKRLFSRPELIDMVARARTARGITK